MGCYGCKLHNLSNIRICNAFTKHTIGRNPLNILPLKYYSLSLKREDLRYVRTAKVIMYKSQSEPFLKEQNMHCNPVQGQYRARTGFSLCSKFSQGKTCFHYREPLFSLQGPCIHYREFPVRITTQGNPCSHYRE